MIITCPNCQKIVPMSEFRICELDYMGMSVSAMCPNCKTKIVIEAYGELDVYEESEDGVCF